MLYLFLAIVAALSVAVYLLVVFRAVPGAVEERWGELEELPQDLGQWTRDADSAPGRAAQAQGLVREERLWLDSDRGWFRGERLVRQVRLRDVESGVVVSHEPDVPLKRQRKRPS